MMLGAIRYAGAITLILLVVMMKSGASAAAQDTYAFRLPTVFSSGGCATVVGAGQSIQAAIDRASNGDKICVRAGVYHETVRIRAAKQGLSLVAFPDERPIIDGEGRLPDSGGNPFSGLISIAAADTTISGFEVRHSTGRGIVIAGSPNVQGVRNVVVRNMVIHGNWNQGLTVRGVLELPARNIVVESNVFYDNARRNADGSAGGAGLNLVSTVDSVVAGNHIYKNHGLGVVIDWYTANIVVEDNVIFDNKSANLYLNRTQSPVVQRNFIYCTADPNFWSEGLALRDEDTRAEYPLAPPSAGQVIVNNIVAGCKTNFTVSSQIHDGPARGGLHNAVVANNTFVHARASEAGGGVNVKLDARARYSDSRFVNNLLVQAEARNLAAVFNGPTDFTTFLVANNLYSTAPLAGWFPGETGRVIGDPLLVSHFAPATGALGDATDYQLTSGSPAIDAAQPLSHVIEDYFRQSRTGATDIGAHEHRAP